MRSVITKFFGQTEVDGVDEVSLFAQTHQKVIRLDVAVNEVFAMDELNTADLQKINILFIKAKKSASLKVKFLPPKHF